MSQKVNTWFRGHDDKSRTSQQAYGASKLSRWLQYSVMPFRGIRPEEEMISTKGTICYDMVELIRVAEPNWGWARVQLFKSSCEHECV